MKKLILGSITAIAIMAVGLHGAPTAMASDAETPPMAVVFSADHCVRCDGCYGGGHFAEMHPAGQRTGDPHVTCQGSGSCTEHPDNCGVLPEPTAILEDARVAALGDISKLRELAESYPSVVTLNEARGSLQVRGCDGVSIIANLPIGEANAMSTEESAQ